MGALLRRAAAVARLANFIFHARCSLYRPPLPPPKASLLSIIYMFRHLRASAQEHSGQEAEYAWARMLAIRFF